MEIEYSPKFFRQFKKLPMEVKEQAVIYEKLFRKNPFNPKLKTHKLHGTIKEYWAFSIFLSGAPVKLKVQSKKLPLQLKIKI